MAFAYVLNAGFEGAATDFDSAITDTQSKSLGYLHYTDLIRDYNVVPWRGAYVWGIDQSVGTKTTAVNQTQAAFNVADDDTYAIGCAVYVKDMTMGNGDRLSLVKAIESGGGAGQGVIQLYYTTAGGLQILASQDHDTAVGSNPVAPFSENEWHWIELRALVDTGGAGTFDFFLDGEQVGSQVGTITNVAVTDLYVGAINGDATTTAGYIFFDDITGAVDTAGSTISIGYPQPRFPYRRHVINAKEHLFIGPGTVDEIQVVSGTSPTMSLYDTDTTDTSNLVATETAAGQGATQTPITFERGCYCVLGGTSPQAIIQISQDPFALNAPTAYGSEAAVKNYAAYRKRRPGNA